MVRPLEVMPAADREAELTAEQASEATRAAAAAASRSMMERRTIRQSRRWSVMDLGGVAPGEVVAAQAPGGARPRGQHQGRALREMTLSDAAKLCSLMVILLCVMFHYYHKHRSSFTSSTTPGVQAAGEASLAEGLRTSPADTPSPTLLVREPIVH
ncbi:unnamed protein product [Prorocentrum cordatum]|uniref:Uncharacterized protein n=1 Tax=Prorocentrum cordatum TaxID=2364126 RepID=A0ABN9R1Q4_9DINO|nr:unnamed protein product [Polarella glacialis]